MQTIGVLVLSATLVVLALFVLLHNRHAAENRRFALAALAIAGWIIGISFALASNKPAVVVALGRLGFAFASVIPFALLWMFDAFAIEASNRRRLLITLAGTGCLASVALSVSPWIVAGADVSPERTTFVHGPGHKLFAVYFLLCFVMALATLWRTMQSAAGVRRLQLRYLLLGILLGGTGAITTNLILPLVLKTSRYSVLGPYFSLLVVSFSAHAIIRHRLMDIRVAIRQGAIYVSAILASILAFVVVAKLSRFVSGHDTTTLSLTEALVLATLVAIIFQPLKAWIQRSFNRYVYREKYDFQRTIREASRQLSSTLELRSLLRSLSDTIENTFKAEAVSVYLLSPIERHYVAQTSSTESSQWNPTSVQPSIPGTSPIVTFMLRQRRPLVQEEAVREDGHAHSDAARTLQDLRGAIAFPLFEEHSLAGILVVGPKKSGDPYFSEDIDLLSTLVGQAAVALKNAHLYREVVLVNEYVDNILSTMASGVIAVDATGSVSLFNRAAERLTGLNFDRRIHRSYADLPMALVQPLRTTLLESKALSQLETSIQTPSGIALPLVFSTAPLQGKDGATHGALIVFSDLSRLKELEHEKQRAERLASFGSLASGVAHEIKNPLVAIRTFAELLPERFSDIDFREDFSKVVVREIDRIDNLVARLRGIASAPQQQTGAVDIRQPISDTLKLLRGQLEQSRTLVRFTADDEPFMVSIDEAQLKQLFLNLFQNALEAMGSGGELNIRVNRIHASSGSTIVLDISDTGPGIPDSVKAHIFEPFFTTKPTGSGLGLAICRSIVDAHRGSIRAEDNHPESGTTIVVELPTAGDSADSLQPVSALKDNPPDPPTNRTAK